jgi:hypothetical protein
MEREATQVAESFTSTQLTKGPPVTEGADGLESLGQADGAQGVLVQPE